MSQEALFDELADFLLQEGTFYPPSELQGLFTGFFIAGGQSVSSIAQDMQIFLELEHIADTTKLESLAKKVSVKLLGEALDYEVALPDDEQPLAVRMKAAAAWCEGFLAGFSLQPMEQKALPPMEQKALPPLVSEALNDYAAIAQVDVEHIEEDEDSEKDYAEIVEFLRLSAMSLVGLIKPQAQHAKGADIKGAGQYFEAKKLH